MEHLPGSISEPRHQEEKGGQYEDGKVVLSSIGERIVILKARRDIEPFEQLRFDYGEKFAQALFDDSS